ncbi:hypothetical protein P154DRAFT_523804 [Amniculicola lignicola CBS 123094]|uniref:C3H1-type domain-containing protein n=1 Tax=Amniculicola lignicola CBS 123094 TaxID=1392246 RepID=A0A6A5WA34_9PLEO|nr:hypothetical protein P154DRAFT_523804 [Amniculicola lignicola CBS 123094]
MVCAAADFEARLATIVAVEQQKSELVQDLITRVKLLDQSLSDSKQQLERERDISDMYQKRDKAKDMELRGIKQSLAQMSYVSVLVDGDCMTFVDDVLQKGEAGGRQAARQLKSSIVEYIRDHHPDVPVNVKVVIRVFANLAGLAKTCHEAGVYSSPVDLGYFVNGFNKEDALCDMVNAGDGKECADEKIRALFQMNMENVQCAHVVFAGSADNGYARLLGPHIDSTRITLLEGPPFAKELAEFASRFRTFHCPAVFRQSKLLRRGVSLDVTPPRTPALEKTAMSNYAVVATTSTDGTQSNQVNKSVAFGSSSRTGKIARNAAGHRIDLPLSCTNGEVKTARASKSCNEYHILGQCSYGKGCTFKHGTRVTGKQLEALRSVARLSSCSKGLSCGDPQCILGHRCTKQPCRNRGTCFFPGVMHNVDVNIVSWSG